MRRDRSLIFLMVGFDFAYNDLLESSAIQRPRSIPETHHIVDYTPVLGNQGSKTPLGSWDGTARIKRNNSETEAISIQAYRSLEFSELPCSTRFSDPHIHTRVVLPSERKSFPHLKPEESDPIEHLVNLPFSTWGTDTAENHMVPIARGPRPDRYRSDLRLRSSTKNPAWLPIPGRRPRHAGRETEAPRRENVWMSQNQVVCTGGAIS